MKFTNKTAVSLVVTWGLASGAFVTGHARVLQDGNASSVSTDLGVVTPIDYPGAAGTLAADINAEGAIVGRYSKAGLTHGFLRSPEGDFTPIDYPGSLLTVAAAINDDGAIAGQYSLPSAPTQRHGFLLKDGQFTTFDPPGSKFTNALGINERGDIVGRYCTLSFCGMPGSGNFHGFLLRDGEITTIDVPGALETDAFKISGSGDIVGGFLTPDRKEQFFVWSHDEFTTFALPGGQPVSLDNGGINERGELVGVYCDSALPCLIVPMGTHGLLMSSGNFNTIDIPGARATSALGINARGDIVGQYADATGNHAFLLSRSRN